MIGLTTALAMTLSVTSAQPPEATSPSPLTLDQAWRQALRRHDGLVANRTRVAAARAKRREALAALLPRLSAGATYTLNDQPTTLGGSSIIVRHDIRANVAIDVPLFDGPALFERAAAEETVGVYRAQMVEEEQTVLMETARTYVTALLAERLAAAARSDVETRGELLDAANARKASGHAVELDIARAEASVHAARRKLAEADGAVADARDALSLAMGVEPGSPRALVRPVIPPASEEGASAEVRARLTGLRAEADALAESRSGAWAMHAPRLSLTGWVAGGPSTYQDPDGVSLALMLTATWKLYDGGARYARLQQVEADLGQAAALLRRAKLEVNHEVSQARRRIATNERRLVHVRAEREAATRALDLAARGFRLGKGTSLDVLNAQDAAIKAQVAQATEELELLLARLTLQRALGRLATTARRGTALPR